MCSSDLSCVLTKIDGSAVCLQGLAVCRRPAVQQVGGWNVGPVSDGDI